ncbi:bifunctional nicotinamidase/pyrazinamidase [Candidatus Fermentibacteria bacterium]|nr:bifunctional nicotinamidase/pyrazinamidase [Candidatus Fermentibacteria bacterium]
MKALIVVDVQNDFCPGGALAVPDGDRIIPVINRISPRFPVVVLTQDWHPEGHVSFATSHQGAEPGQTVTLEDGTDQMLWPDHCVRGTKGAELHQRLETNTASLILRKGMNVSLDSYSAFMENDRSTRTGLEGYLRERNVDQVYVAGLALDYCVLFTATDCSRLGFDTVLVRDATRGVGIPEGSVERALEKMKEASVRMVDSGEIAAE